MLRTARKMVVVKRRNKRGGRITKRMGWKSKKSLIFKIIIKLDRRGVLRWLT